MNPAGIEVRRHPRARKLRLSVDPVSGRVRLTLPPRAALKPALQWAEEQAGWIAAQRARMPESQPFAPGGLVPFAGIDLTLDHRPAAPRTPYRDGDRLVCGGPSAGFAGRIARWLRREALRVLSAETAEFAAKAEVTVSMVAVGDPRGRWGSCSSRGAIRYSWRLILAPDWVRRATVAHEVAHRVHMNHSPVFHALVAELLERDPAPARAWLRANGARLHGLGRDS
ncbi:SprT family zinc-dependent metalloprotease [Sphingomonas sp.]|uniref:M48 family metallopeptidase n=1 Tax=Sphingomonas sp. TaxID=28214 RepID=UPI002C386AB3|nr:SprT family zinc-dependent metalloprotease [Sphingomonas sp.]HWK36000.1 SprT family zinc-dependent metalloprotease [Sphingomonas sp.]